MSFEGLRNLHTTWRIYNRNIQNRKWEPEAPYMKEVVKPGDICLHFGGSDGRHSYLMAQYIGPDALHILRRDVSAAVQEGVSPGAEREINRSTR